MIARAFLLELLNGFVGVAGMSVVTVGMVKSSWFPRNYVWDLTLVERGVLEQGEPSRGVAEPAQMRLADLEEIRRSTPRMG